MFQMVNEESIHPLDRKMMIVMIVVASACIHVLVALGAAVYFLAFLPYTNR